MTQITDTPAGTATTAGARAHARDQHSRTADTMRHVPVATAPSRVTGTLPDGAADRLIWSETLAFGRYTTMHLARGTRLRFADTGDACVHTLLYRAGALHERFNAADTVKVPWQAYPSTGHPLLSDAGRVLATIVEDTSGSHDAFTGATTLAGNTARYGAGTAHSASPAARELLTLGALKNGLGPRDVAPSLTFFKGIRVHDDGGIGYTGGAGTETHVDLLLQLDTVVVLANTAHPLDPRTDFTGTAVEITAWRAPEDLTALADGSLVGPLAPEHLQALNNTEHDLAARSTR